MTAEEIIDKIDWPFPEFRLRGHRTSLIIHVRTLKELGVADVCVDDLLRSIYLNAFAEADLQRNAPRPVFKKKARKKPAK